jgi:hypothetical protein
MFVDVGHVDDKSSTSSVVLGLNREFRFALVESHWMAFYDTVERIHSCSIEAIVDRNRIQVISTSE